MTTALDGNAIGGLLLEVFGRELTAETGVCTACRATAPVAELAVYVARPVPSYGVGAVTRW
jgi:hypothetical protein